MKITLGHKYKDKVSGFIGIAISRCTYFRATAQVHLQPVMEEGGSYVEPKWFEEGRLESLSATSTSAQTPSSGSSEDESTAEIIVS